MFNCTNCEKTAAPSEPMTITAAVSRVTTYTNYHPLTEEEIVTTGLEIVRENRLCQQCAGVQPKKVVVLTDLILKAKARAMAAYQHARKCREPHTADCDVCRSHMDFFAALPPKILNEVLYSKVLLPRSVHVHQAQRKAS